MPHRTTGNRGLGRRAGLALASLSLLAAALLAPPGALAACPNEAIRAQQGAPGLALPDCRAYEQVTPVQKDGTQISAAPFPHEQASPRGDRVAFTSDSNLPGAEGAQEFPTYVASRTAAGWQTRGLLFPPALGKPQAILGWSEDLSQVAEFGVLNGTSYYGLYLRDTASGANQLVANLGQGRESRLPTPVAFSRDGSRFTFVNEEGQLPPGPGPLYEWDSEAPQGERLGQAGLPTGSSAVAGAYRSPDTISADGSRVFFSAEGSLYVREGAVSTAIPGGHFDAASRDGSLVLVDDEATLSEYSVPRRETIASLTPPGGVLGVLGMGEDGAYVYFVNEAGQLYEWHRGAAPLAIAQLTPINYDSSPRGFTPVRWDELRSVGEETPTQEGAQDFLDWVEVPAVNAGTPYGKTARVDPSGEQLLFRHDERLYLWSAATQQLRCVSCNAGGEGGRTALIHDFDQQIGVALDLHPPPLARSLSASGQQVFFDTKEALLPGDTDKATDVYEWEAPGAGSCAESSPSFFATDGGCLYLISPGSGPGASYLADASASGEDVFFFTEAQLVGQDRDRLRDLYDARVGGGIAAQQAPPPPCEGETACRGPLSPPPALSSPATASFQGPVEGPGHPRRPRCRRGLVRRHGRCLKRHPKRRRRHHHHRGRAR
jgi:hypothetical protein